MTAEAARGVDSGRTIPTLVRAVLVVFLLYLFLVGIAFLEGGIAGLGEGFQEELLRQVSNPISGLCAGILATVLVQSSSVTTATIVGLVGAGTLPLTLAVPMIMGANIGTTVTSTLAALGSIRRSVEFRRALAAATVHDFFNIAAVVILLPLELTTGLLSRSARWLTELLIGTELNTTGPGGSVIRSAVRVPVGLVETAIPPSSWRAVIFLLVGLALIFLALGMITRNMRRLVAGGVERLMNEVIGRGGGVIGIAVGIGVTIAVQSSSITTSILVPLVASGILTLPNAYPITVGANIGTTITALLASLAVILPDGLTIALVHTLFNVVATLLLFPIPKIRMVPVRLAERFAELASGNRWILLVYAVGAYMILPLVGVIFLQ